MKTPGIILTAVAATCLLTSCTRDEIVAPSPARADAMNPLQATPSVSTAKDLPCPDVTVPLLNKRWALRVLSGRPISLAANAAAPWMTFNAGPDQSIDAFGGCNTITGTFTFDCESLNIADLCGTRTFCAGTHDLETFFLAALRQTDAFEVRNERLTLFSGTAEVAVLYDHQLASAPAREHDLANGEPITPPYIPVGNE